MGVIKEKHPLVIQFIKDMIEERHWKPNVEKVQANIINNMILTINKNPLEITREDIIKYLLHKRDLEKWGNRDTVFNHLFTIRLFYRYLKSKGLVLEVPEVKVNLPRFRASEFDRSLFKDIRRQKRMIDSTRISPRDRAIWYLIYMSTALIKDLTKIKIKNMDLDRCRIYFDEDYAQEGRFEYIIVPDVACFAIKQYMMRVKINSEYLFPNSQGGEMSYYYIHNIIARFTKKSKVRIRAKDKRALRIKAAIDEGVDLSVLKYYYGIKNIKVFNPYIESSSRRLKPFREYRKYQRGLKSHEFI